MSDQEKCSVCSKMFFPEYDGDSICSSRCHLESVPEFRIPAGNISISSDDDHGDDLMSIYSSLEII